MEKIKKMIIYLIRLCYAKEFGSYIFDKLLFVQNIFCMY